MLSKNLIRGMFYLFVVLGLLVAIDIIAAVKRFESPGPSTAETVVEIAPGSSLRSMSAKLEEAGVIHSSRDFNMVVRILRASGALQAGEYAFPAGISGTDAFKMIREGKTRDHSVTLAEGLSVAQVLTLLDDNETLLGPVSDVPEEGSLLPETYHFKKGETRDGIIRRAQMDMRLVLDRLWSARAADFPLASKQEALILASIVEKETAVEGERRRIAAVFLNRLQQNMRLQTDPTVIYGITGGLPLGRAILQSDLDRETPYNTYRIRGLPLGPIANPGRASLEAVFDPEFTDELYFVADGSGGHVFATTLEEHNRNVREWRQIKSQRQ